MGEIGNLVKYNVVSTIVYLVITIYIYYYLYHFYFYLISVQQKCHKKYYHHYG